MSRLRSAFALIALTFVVHASGISARQNDQIHLAINPAQATLFELQNQYGKLAEVKQATTDGNALAYTYDDAGRLTQVSGSVLSGRSESFGLDAGNNRTSHNKTGSTLWQYDNANQLTQRPAPGGSGTVNYQYDASGNQTVKTISALAEPYRTTRYSYDALNRLAQVRDGAGQLIASYSYDPFDRRLRKTLGDSATLASSGQAAGQVTSYLHTDWGLLAEANAAGQIQASYGYNPQRDNGVAPLYARVPAKDSLGNPTGDYRYTYYHNDHLGTPQRLTDKAGNLLWSAQYDAYGKAQVQTTASAQLATVNPLRQPGQYLDAETGLHYNDRRYYDADTGRYVSRDPIGFEGGINLYGYAGASPSRFTDPTGEFLVPALPCMAYNYARCMAICGVQSAAIAVATGGCIDIGQIAKDCAVDCLLSMLPIPDPCGKFGKLFSAAVGIGASLFENSFEQDTLVHTRVKTDSGYQAKLKPIKDIQVGDEVLAWDELQAHDNAQLAQSGQAAQTLQAAYQQANLGSKLGDKSAYSPINTGVSSYENKSNFGTLSGVKPAQRYEKVTDTISSFKEQTLLHISLDKGQTLQATAGHPFKTSEGWRDAVLLKKDGQLLLGGEADAAERFATILEIREEVKTTAVFNLEVANLHTFFVRVDGVVVHNGASPPNLSPPGAGRNGAFREAKRYLDIAMNAPCKIKPARDKKNNLTGKKEYDFGDGKVIRQDPPHNYGPGNSQNRGNHFNTPDNAHFDF